MKYKILLIATALFACTAAWAQINGGGYNPENPGDPNEPDRTSKHNLSLVVEPTGAGSFNISSGKYREGTNLDLYAYTNSNYTFKELVIGDSVIKSYSVTMQMPSHDLTITARYAYNPPNPEDPNQTSGIQNTSVIHNDNRTVYSVTGTVIRRNATSADISSLPKGIYIVDGKKFIVR